MSDHPPPADTPQAGRHAALGGTVARGMSFMVLVSLFGKFLSTFATIILGFLLSEDDFGLYGIALGLAGVISVLRDGGLRQIAIQRGPKGFDRLVGPVGWMSLAFNTTAGLILAALAPIAARIYGEPTLLLMLLVTAASAPMITVGSLNRAQLEVQLRYGALARINTWNNIARYVSMVVLAALGFGAFSFVLPYIIVAVVDAAVGISLTRNVFLTRAPRVRVWPVLFARARWTLAGTLGLAVLNRADYVVLGLFVATGVVGIYMFAFQLAIQVNTMLAANFQKILFPTLTRFASEPERHRAAITRATRTLSLVSAAGGVGLACIFPYLESLIWDGKWRAAVIPAQLMCLALPMRMCLSIHNAAALSLAEFRAWATFNWLQGLGLVVATATAGWLFGAATPDDPATTAAAVTAIIAAFYAAVIPLMIATRLRRYTVPFRTTIGSVFVPWSIAATSGLLVVLPTVLIPDALPHATTRFDQAVYLLVTGALFTLLNTAAVRVFMPNTIADLVGMMPGRFRPMLRRTLRLPRITNLAKSTSTIT